MPGGSTSRSSSTCSPGWSSAGRRAGPCEQTWPSTPSRWPSTTAGPPASRGSSIILTAGSQYLSVRYSERLDDDDIVASVGSKGDSFDNAMAESFNGLYKWELIYPKGPWSGIEDVEFATLTYVDWFNHRRLHGEIEPGPGFTTPAAFEAAWREANRCATLSGPQSAAIEGA